MYSAVRHLDESHGGGASYLAAHGLPVADLRLLVDRLTQ